MSKPSAERSLAFMRLLHAFQSTERAVRAPDLIRYENDAEHSYLLAMMAWYLVDSLKLPLNRSLVLEYALAHDLVEVYAGDTPAFDTAARVGKDERERMAAERIASEFPEIPSLHGAIAAYEERRDDEAIFVYTLDKLLPVLSNYLENGYSWREIGITFERFIELKRPPIAANECISSLLEQMIVMFERDKTRYFKI